MDRGHAYRGYLWRSLSLIALLLAGACQPVPEIRGQPTAPATACCSGLELQDWNGSPVDLDVNRRATLNATPTGALVLAIQNLSTMDDMGRVSLASGSNPPE